MTNSIPNPGPDSLLTDLQDCLAACTAAELKGETNVLIRACKYLMKQVPRVITLVAEKDRDIESLRKSLEQIREWHCEGHSQPKPYTVFFAADQALSSGPLQP